MFRVRRSVTVRLSRFACEAVAGEEGVGPDQIPVRVVRAIRCYLNDRGSDGLGWRYPGFFKHGRESSDGVALQLRIDEDLWRSLEEEAERQGVSAQQMVAHAAFYVAAEVNAGRITRRILEGFDEETEKKPAS